MVGAGQDGYGHVRLLSLLAPALSARDSWLEGYYVVWSKHIDGIDVYVCLQE